MIFSIVCEELGLVGAGTIIVLFLILIWRFFVIATHAPDLFGALIAVGAMAHMMIQVILNIGLSECKPGGAAVNNNTHSFAVRFAPCCDFELITKC